MSLVRVSKLMAEQGLCSRREADKLIEQGLVIVDGQKAQLGMKVEPTAKIEVAPQGKRTLESKVTVVLNKPVGFVSSQPEKGYKSALSLIRPETQSPLDKGPKLKRRTIFDLAPAGRLDIDSKGLLLLTQDGRIAREVIGSQSNVEKEYLVRVDGQISNQVLAKLRHGISLDGKPLKQAQVEIERPQLLRFTLTEGRKRQIRRMCEVVNLKVLSLKRVRIGPIKLGGLKEGQWRHLRTDELF